MAERLREEFTHAGLNVEWISFRGGHEIPESVLARLGSFITRVMSRS
jgi:phospholipase/carboxylesterase